MSDAAKRLAALQEYNIMDTPPEEAFDDLTLLTSFICSTPMAMVTLLDSERQWFKSKVGIGATETPIEYAFCAHAIEQEKVFLVPDASCDPRFSANPLVTGDPNIRFYAGAPLITSEGVGIGTLCAIDRIPREFTFDQQDALTALARSVMRALEMRKLAKALCTALKEKRDAEKEVQTLKEFLPMCAWCRKVRDDESFWHHLEHYLASHADIQVSHGVCPDCAEKMQSDINRPRPALPLTAA